MVDHSNRLKIGLDLDQCVFDWQKSHEQKFHCSVENMTVEDIDFQVRLCKYDKNFWSNLDLLERPDFTPTLYATKRINPKSYTKACLKKHHLPLSPIYQVYDQKDNKAFYIKDKCDVLIDDSWFNVQQCLSVGFPALLISRPSNKHIQTKYRVEDLKYETISKKYYELFGKM